MIVRPEATKTHGSPSLGWACDLDRDRETLGILHLRGDRAHPDQLVEPELITAQPGLRWGQEGFTCRADRLVRFLRILDPGGVDARLVRQVVRAVKLRTCCLAAAIAVPDSVTESVRI